MNKFEKKEAARDYSTLSSLSVEEFDSMIDLCKKNDILLVVVLSPTLSHSSDTLSLSYQYMKEKCEKENVRFIDYTHDSQYDNKHYFRDKTHMNYWGAEVFSANLMSDLKEIIIANLK